MAVAAGGAVAFDDAVLQSQNHKTQKITDLISLPRFRFVYGDTSSLSVADPPQRSYEALAIYKSRYIVEPTAKIPAIERIPDHASGHRHWHFQRKIRPFRP